MRTAPSGGQGDAEHRQQPERAHPAAWMPRGARTSATPSIATTTVHRGGACCSRSRPAMPTALRASSSATRKWRLRRLPQCTSESRCRRARAERPLASRPVWRLRWRNRRYERHLLEQRQRVFRARGRKVSRHPLRMRAVAQQLRVRRARPARRADRVVNPFPRTAAGLPRRTTTRTPATGSPTDPRAARSPAPTTSGQRGRARPRQPTRASPLHSISSVRTHCGHFRACVSST